MIMGLVRCVCVCLCVVAAMLIVLAGVCVFKVSGVLHLCWSGICSVWWDFSSSLRNGAVSLSIQLISLLSVRRSVCPSDLCITRSVSVLSTRSVCHILCLASYSPASENAVCLSYLEFCGGIILNKQNKKTTWSEKQKIKTFQKVFWFLTFHLKELRLASKILPGWVE